MTKKSSNTLRPSNYVFIPILMSAVWILLTGVKPQELALGLLPVAASVTFLCVILHAQDLELRFELRDVATLWRAPWDILTNTGTLCVVLLKDLLRLKPAGSFYRVCGFKTSRRDPVLAGRRVLATAYTTLSPNSIVIGIDCAQSRMLFHQVQRGEVSAMTRQLGGQP